MTNKIKEKTSEYNKLINRIFNLNMHSIKLGLYNMQKSIEILNIKKKLNKINFIQIAGTNGKGSSAAMLNSLLLSTNTNVGLYTSPHLLRFNERIKVNNNEIKNNEIAIIAKIIFKKCKNIKLTFFEFTTLICFIYFIEKKVEFAVLETGLGGRLDATNIVNSFISIITSISLDHTKYLGTDLDKIAYEKAGIIKSGQTLILANTVKNSIFKKVAKEKNINLVFELGKNIHYTKHDINSIELYKNNLTTNKIDFYINNKIIFNSINVPLRGEHQKDNLSLALCAFYQIYKMFFSKSINSLNTKIINHNLQKTKWPARLQELKNIKRFSELGKLFIDVTHNEQGAKVTSNFFNNNYPNQQITIASSFMKDKDYFNIVNNFLKFAYKIYLFPSTIRGRTLSFEDLNKAFNNYTNIVIYKSINEALDALLKSKGVGLISGSVYNIENIYKILKYDYKYNINI